MITCRGKASKAQIREARSLNKACADEQFDTIQELKTRIQELEAESTKYYEALDGIVCLVVEGVEFCSVNEILNLVMKEATDALKGNTKTVSNLHKQINELHQERAELKTNHEKLHETAGDVYDWAVLHKVETIDRGVWLRLKQALERKK